VSGGPEGALTGACIMIGGEREIFEQHEQLFRDIAAPQAYQFFPGSGRGHFIKMVHNGIEYGMMQSLAEGFALLKKQYPDLPLERVADVYNHRSVIESRLVGWLENALREHGNELAQVSGSVDHTGEAEWTVKSAERLNVNLPVIEKSLAFRVASEKHPSYVGKILSALRNQFGGHSVNSPDSNKKNI
ncbi:MAG: NAD(P)-binding domain-containing protein, partial [Candidatus Paceibacterota bacterium]